MESGSKLLFSCLLSYLRGTSVLTLLIGAFPGEFIGPSFPQLPNGATCRHFDFVFYLVEDPNKCLCSLFGGVPLDVYAPQTVIYNPVITFVQSYAEVCAQNPGTHNFRMSIQGKQCCL